MQTSSSCFPFRQRTPAIPASTPRPHSSIAAKGWLSSVRRDPSSRPRRSEDDGTPLPDEILLVIFAGFPELADLGCRRWHRLVSGEAAFICRRAMKLPGSGVKFLPPLAVGFFHHHPNAAAPRFVPMASASRRFPVLHQNPSSQLSNLVTLRRGKHDMPALKLCVCNPMTGHVHALPPLTDKDSLRHYACTVITSDDYYDGGGERRRSTSTYRLLLVYSRRGFTAFRIYSSDDGSWSSETKVTGARLSRKQMRLTRSGVVARGGHAAYWLAKNLVFGLRLDTLEASVATLPWSGHGLAFDKENTLHGFTPEGRLCTVQLDLPRRPAATSGKRRCLKICVYTGRHGGSCYCSEGTLQIGRDRWKTKEEIWPVEPFSVLDEATTSLKLHWFCERSGVVLFTAASDSFHGGMKGGGEQRGRWKRRQSMEGHSWQQELGRFPWALPTRANWAATVPAGDTPPRVHPSGLAPTPRLLHTTRRPTKRRGRRLPAPAAISFCHSDPTASAPSAPVPDPNPPPHLPRPPLASPGGSAPAAMSEVKQGGDDGAAPRCPPHPGFLRGLCIVCGVKEEDTEGGAPELSIGDDGEMKVVERGEDEAATAAAAARCPPHPGFVLGLCFLCGAKEEDAEGGAPELTIEDELEMTMMEQGVDEAAAARCPPHPGFVSGLCLLCGAKEDDDAEGSTSGLAAGYIHGAPAQPASATTRFIIPGGDTHLGNLLRERKLTLILDLDHTLLNSTALDDFSPAEVRNGFSPTTVDDLGRGLFRLDGHGIRMLTKLRPFAQGFLEKASAMFEMHVYTLGDQAYARAVVSLLDPYAVYFGERIVSKAESTEPFVKSLDVIPGAEVVAVVILDDSDRAWPGHQDNLILMDRYHYFASTCRNYGYDTSSMAEQNCDAREHDGSLAVALQVLRRVHQLFFDSVVDGYFPDVRQVIAEVRREVLRGCTVVFSRLNYLEDFAEDTPMWTLAVQLGAVCKVDVDETVTHVVAEHPGTEKGAFLVNWKWIQAAKFRWILRLVRSLFLLPNLPPLPPKPDGSRSRPLHCAGVLLRLLPYEDPPSRRFLHRYPGVQPWEGDGIHAPRVSFNASSATQSEPIHEVAPLVGAAAASTPHPSKAIPIEQNVVDPKDAFAKIAVKIT
ncbi:hypothetical protein HU200_017154 [Digitaria exilis]|uniref:FCP1 homology domain-containing protein n=1 Tax=Digitaria exilis TaxID=1010633 RepID=A0A835F781_9POAL|nr:hypothetical protein HU200_017154 [Digitaria exilis]